MKKQLSKFIGVCLITVFMFGSFCMPCFAFDSVAHEYVTRQGTKILKDLSLEECENLFDKTSEEILYEYCKRPDIDENDGLFKWHFYNTATEKNFLGEDESALTKFQDHYDNAVNFYNMGDKNMAFQELGRAIHFLEDLNTPVHTNAQSLTDAVFQAGMHSQFESYCNSIRKDYVASMKVAELSYYKYNSTKTIAISSANMANENFFVMYNNFQSKRVVAGNSLVNAQKAVCGVLFKFCNEIA